MTKKVHLKFYLMVVAIFTISSTNLTAQNPLKNLNTPVKHFKLKGDDFVQRDMTAYIQNVSTKINPQYKKEDEELLWIDYLNRPNPSVKTMEKYFKKAAKEFNVSYEILRVVAYVESNWTQIGPTMDLRWGVMGLADNSYCTSLKDAAKLLKLSSETLKDNPKENIRGYAALLAEYAGKERHSFSKYEDWFNALEKTTGHINAEIREMAVEEYYNILTEGINSKSLWNEQISIKSHKIDISKKLVHKKNRNSRINKNTMESDWYSGAIKDETDNQRSREGTDIDMWVNHWMGTGTYAGCISWFHNSASWASAHFCINRDGTNTQMVPISRKAWHASINNFNLRSIGVEHYATVTHPEYWNDQRMLKESAEVAKYYCDLHNIPKVQRVEVTTPGIYGHTDIPGVTKNCPGPMPWDTWFALLNGNSAPVLKAVLSSNNNKGVTAKWSAAATDQLAGFRLYYAENDNLSSWKLAANETTLTAAKRTITINDPASFVNPPSGDVYFFKMTSVDTQGNESDATDVYARSSNVNGNGLQKVLIVDGFDRKSGSYKQNTHSFSATYMKGLQNAGNFVVSTCANEAVTDATINLIDYNTVIWFLGDESTADESFSTSEQEKIKTYFKAGGKMFVTGSEIAWDLDYKGSSADKSFYNNYLKADYTGDGGSTGRTPATALTTDFSSVSLQFGQVYTEDSPDEITTYGGSTKAFKYANGKYSGICYKGPIGWDKEGAIVHLSFALETVSNQTSINTFFSKLMQYFSTGEPVADFTITGAPAETDIDVSFNGSSSSDPDGTVTSYAWNFGDGNTASGATAQHAYSAAGTYNITLTVTDNDNNTASVTKSVTITTPVQAGSKMIDDFETNEGHFYLNLDYSGTTKGISSSSASVTRVTNNPKNGVGSLKLVMSDDANSNDDWFIRLLSGGGNPTNNIAITKEGKVQLWLSSSMTQSNAQIFLWIDDSDGIEESARKTIINDGNYHLYEWSLTDNNQWNALTGNGAITNQNITIDALMLTSPNNSPWTAIYIDDVYHNIAESALTLSNNSSANINETVNFSGTVSNDVTSVKVKCNGEEAVTQTVSGGTYSVNLTFATAGKDMQVTAEAYNQNNAVIATAVSTISVYQTVMIDDFEVNQGHFIHNLTYSGSTQGINPTTASVARVTNYPKNGSGSLKLVMSDDTNSSSDWFIRMLSGGGAPANNVSISADGKIQLWLASSTANVNSKIFLWIDDSDGIEESQHLTINNDGNYHLYEWNIEDSNVWTAFTGNGAITGQTVTIDAIMFESPNNSAWNSIYIDDVVHVTTSASTTNKSSNSIDDEVPTQFSNIENIVLYPTIAKDRVFIKYNNQYESVDANINIYDISGKRFYSKSLEINTGQNIKDINVSALPDGFYLLNLKAGNTSKTLKFIKK